MKIMWWGLKRILSSRFKDNSEKRLKSEFREKLYLTGEKQVS